MKGWVAAPPAVAFALLLAYALYLSPEWEPTRDDQRQYLALAHGLAERLEYTRATADEPFIPEPIRAPGYPLFLAPLCRVGACDHWPIALSQGVLLALIAIVVHGIARRVLSARAALVAAGAVACYPTLAYYAALALSDVLGAALLALGCYAFLRAVERADLRWAAACGAALGALVLDKPQFVLLPLPLVALGAFATGAATRRRVAQVLAGVVVFAIVVAPWFAYSYANFGRPLGRASGAVLLYGYVQGMAPADFDDFERRHIDEATRDIAAYNVITDRVEQVRSWPAFEDSLQAHAIALIAHDPLGWAGRGVGRSIVLWATDMPVRVADVAGIPPAVKVGLIAAQLLLFVCGLVGAIVLARRRGAAGGLPLVVIAYLGVVSFPFLTEERYSLPAKPFLIIAAVALVSALRRGVPSGTHPDAPTARGARAPGA